MWTLLVLLLASSLSVSTVSCQELREVRLPRLQTRQVTNGDLTTVCACGGAYIMWTDSLNVTVLSSTMQ